MEGVRVCIDRIYATHANKHRSVKAGTTHTRNEENAREALARGYAVGVGSVRVGKRARAFMLKTTNVLQLSALRMITEVTDMHVTLGGTKKTLKVDLGEAFVQI